MASSDPGAPPAPGSDEDRYVPSRFVVGARWAALTWPLLLGLLGLSRTELLGAAGRELGDVATGVLLLVAALPTIPLFAALPFGEGWIVVAFGALTSLPVWVWGGAALARRIEATHGPDWRRWTLRYLGFPVVALFFGGLLLSGVSGGG